MKLQFILMVLPSILLLTSCKILGDAGRESVPFQHVMDSEFLKVQDSQTAVFKNKSAWTEFWNNHVTRVNSDGEKVSAPVIDFNKNMLIAVFWGNNGYSGCSSFVDAIESVSLKKGMISVNVGKLPDLGSCLMMVSPLQVIEVEKREQPVTFHGQIPK